MYIYISGPDAGTNMYIMYMYMYILYIHGYVHGYIHGYIHEYIPRYLVPCTWYLVQGSRYHVPLQKAPVSGKVPVSDKVLRRPVTDRPGKR